MTTLRSEESRKIPMEIVILTQISITTIFTEYE